MLSPYVCVHFLQLECCGYNNGTIEYPNGLPDSCFDNAQDPTSLHTVCTTTFIPKHTLTTNAFMISEAVLFSNWLTYSVCNQNTSVCPYSHVVGLKWLANLLYQVRVWFYLTLYSSTCAWKLWIFNMYFYILDGTLKSSTPIALHYCQVDLPCRSLIWTYECVKFMYINC